jgi:hypothetical protein
MARTAESLLHGSLGPVRRGPAAELTAMPAVGGVERPALERLIGGNYWRWVPLAGLWLALAFLIAFGIYVNDVASGRTGGIGRLLYATIPHVTVWMLVSPAIYRALYELVEGTRRAAAALLLAAWSVIGIGASTLLCYLGIAVRDEATPTPGSLFTLFVAPPMGPAYQAMNTSILLIALAAFGILLAQRQRARARWDAVQASLRDAELERRLAEARLQALQSRINPHFLLNSLNAIAGYVQSGRPDEAFDTVARLGTLLQSALRQGEMRDIPLGEEFDFAERYAQLLEMRHGARFRCRFTIPDALCTIRVPALIIQPLIENAVRHGMPAGRPLQVDVRAYEQGRSFVIEVEDDGLGLAAGAAQALPAGHGLANVAERLRLVFGDDAALVLESRPTCGCRVKLRFAA